MANIKGKNQPRIIPNPLETAKVLGNEINKTIKKDVVEAGSKDLIKQLLGIGFDSESTSPQTETQPSAESGPVEIFSAAKHKGEASQKKTPEKKAKPESRQEAALHYNADIKKSSEKASKVEVSEMSRNMQEIKAELQKLVQESKTLQMEFAEVSVEQSPTNVGKYHVTFFEWMLSVVRLARQKVEDSGSWLNTVKGKSKQKINWSDTKVNQSNERNVATSVG